MSVDNGNLSIRLPIAAEVFTSPFPYNLTSASLEDITTVAPTNSTVLPELDYIYTFTEIVVAIVAVIGNALTITVFAVDRKLRRLTNYYIVALAVADLLVGVLGIPFAILTSIGLPKPLWPCLLMLSTLLVLCTTSIFCLVAVSVDRYWAILHPLRYSRVMTARIARYIILMCWVAGTCIGLLPLMGWHKEYKNECYFVEVMDYRYLVFLYFATIVGPGILMAVFYAHIYTVVLKQTKLSVKSEHGTLRQIAAHEPQAESGSLAGQSSQRQRPRFLMSRSQSRQMGDMSRLDSRRSSTTTNIVSQLQIPRSSQSWHPQELFHSFLPSSHADLHQVDPPAASCSPSSSSFDLLHPHHPPSCHNKPSCHHHHSPTHHTPESHLRQVHKDNVERLLHGGTPTEEPDTERRARTQKKNKKNTKPSEDNKKKTAAGDDLDASSARSDTAKSEEEGGFASMYRQRTPSIKISKDQDGDEEVTQLLGHELNKPAPRERGVGGWRGIINKIFSEEDTWGSRRGSEVDSRRGSTLSHFLFQVTHPSRREVKAARSLSIIVLFFMFCWFPLYTINFFQYVCPNCAVPGIVMHMTIILSHLNSAINPLLYAYHMKDFRMAIKMFILHRILRRPLPADYVFNRSLVSPHHSTLYRVTVGGAASQNMNLHTPHAHNTPMTGSPSPLVGTPKGGQRSRTSTLGSSGPWPPSRGLSPSPSSPRNPPITPLNAVSHPSSLLRPRAATITTHTAPASALKPGSPVKPGSPPEIRSGPKLLEASQRRQVTTLPSDILMAVTEGLSANVNASRPDTAHSQSDDNLVKVSVTKPKEDVHASPNLGSDTTASNPDEKAEESSVMPKEQVMSEQPETKSQCEETIKNVIPSESIQKTESTKPQACQEGKLDPLTEDILKRDSEEESDPIEFITPPLPNGSACSGQEESESQNHQAEEPSPRREELKSLFESSAQSTKPPPREDVLDSRTAGQKLGESRFPRELYKYIPKILRRRQGTLKTKSSKNTKSWWPELMKQRSYHDLSGVKSSEQVRRTWSACSAMDG